MQSARGLLRTIPDDLPRTTFVSAVAVAAIFVGMAVGSYLDLAPPLTAQGIERRESGPTSTTADRQRIIKALKEGTAPWQKPWKHGERIMPHNFGSGRDDRGGNAVYLVMQGLDRGYADPRWGGDRQIQETGGHVRKGETGTPIMYVDFRQRRTARDEQGQPIRDEGGGQLEWVQQDRPLVKLHHVFNVEQTEGLKLRSREIAAPGWDRHERAEALNNA